MSVPVFAAALLYAAAPADGAVLVAQPPAVAPAGTPAVSAVDTTGRGSPAPVDQVAPVVPSDAAVTTALTIAAPTAPDGNEIVVSARVSSPTDPLAKINVEAYKAIQAVDDALVAPVSRGYQKSVPSPIRDGLRNFLRNLDEPVSALNYVLQLKPGRAVKSVGRFAINTTIGVAGLLDVAKKKPFNLPYKPNGFANTFACYGIGNGPYFFLPLAGPITMRDLVGLLLDKSIVPMAAGTPFKRPYYVIPAGVIDSLNDRIEQDAVLKQLREESADPYVATRELYLKQRRAEIGAICPRHGDAHPDPMLPPRVGKGVN
jgi:phospholipid-binding lipoprotein MlaA